MNKEWNARHGARKCLSGAWGKNGGRLSYLLTPTTDVCIARRLGNVSTELLLTIINPQPATWLPRLLSKALYRLQSRTLGYTQNQHFRIDFSRKPELLREVGAGGEEEKALHVFLVHSEIDKKRKLEKVISQDQGRIKSCWRFSIKWSSSGKEGWRG